MIEGAGVVGLSPDAVRAVIDARAGRSIARSPGYTDAMAQVPQGEFTLFVDIDGIAEVIGANLPAEQLPELESARQTLDRLDAFVLGAEQSPEHVHVRMFLHIG